MRVGVVPLPLDGLPMVSYKLSDETNMLTLTGQFSCNLHAMHKLWAPNFMGR